MVEIRAPQRSVSHTFGRAIRDSECVSRSVVVLKKTFSGILSLSSSGMITLSQKSIEKIGQLTKWLSNSADIFMMIQLPRESVELGQMATKIYFCADDPARLRELKIKSFKKSLRFYLTSTKVVFIFQKLNFLQLSLRLQRMFVGSSPIFSIVISFLDIKKGWQKLQTIDQEEEIENAEILMYMNKVFFIKAALSLIASVGSLIALMAGCDSLAVNLVSLSVVLSMLSYVRHLLSIYLKAANIHYKDVLVNA